MRLTPIKKTYRALAVYTLIMAAVIIFILLPTVRSLRTIATETERVHEVLNSSYEKNKVLQRTTLKLPQIKNYVNAWEGALITPGTELQFINYLEGLAAAHTLTIKVQPKPFDSSAPHLKHGFDLDIQLTGSFSNTLNFLTALEQSDYYVTIENIDMQKLTGEDGAQSLFTHLVGKIYAQ